MIKRIMLLTALTVACADSSNEAERPATLPELTPKDAAAACAQFTNEGLKIKAKTIAELEAEVGAPGIRTVEVVPNRHVPEQHDSIFTIEYVGMTVQVRKPGPGGEMFEHVIVSKRKWLKFPYFQPGVSAANVIAVLGEPQRREGENLVYECGGGEVDNPVVFETSNGKVEQIVFNYYVD